MFTLESTGRLQSRGDHRYTPCTSCGVGKPRWNSQLSNHKMTLFWLRIHPAPVQGQNGCAIAISRKVSLGKKRSTDIFFEGFWGCVQVMVCKDSLFWGWSCMLFGWLIGVRVHENFGKQGKLSSGSWVLNLTSIFGIVGWFTNIVWILSGGFTIFLGQFRSDLPVIRRIWCLARADIILGELSRQYGLIHKSWYPHPSRNCHYW